MDEEDYKNWESQFNELEFNLYIKLLLDNLEKQADGGKPLSNIQCWILLKYIDELERKL